MTDIVLVDIPLRFIPESMLLMSFIYIFSKQKMTFANYLKSSCIICIVCMISKILSGCYITHVVFNIIFSSIVCIKVNKLDFHTSISLNIIYFLITLISENVNLFLLSNVFKIDLYVSNSSSILNNLYGLPSLLFISLIIFLCYKIKKIKINKDLDNYA